MRPRDLIDVLDPLAMRFDGIRGETNELDPTFGKLRFKLGERTQLSGADGGEIFRVGEENDPFVANELMELDVTLLENMVN